MIGATCAFLFVQPNAGGEDGLKSDPVLDHVYVKLQPLFQKYYPKAKCANQGRDGLHFEYEVTTFEFPFTAARKARGHHSARPKEGRDSVQYLSGEGQLPRSTRSPLPSRRWSGCPLANG